VDDERLEVDADGGWQLWRTMGGEFAGGFAGRLSADRRRRLAAARERAEAASRNRPTRALRDASREAVTLAGRTIAVPDDDRDLAEDLRPLVRLLRRWTDTLASADSGTAGLELRLADGGARLVRHGNAPLRLWPATIRVEAYGRDADSVIRDRASSGPGETSTTRSGEPLTTGRGWSLDLALPRAVDVPEGGRLEVWAWLDLEGPDGPVRARVVAGALD
jgi:hypothetical protein